MVTDILRNHVKFALIKNITNTQSEPLHDNFISMTNYHVYVVFIQPMHDGILYSCKYNVSTGLSSCLYQVAFFCR
jgi:hypothetical protein